MVASISTAELVMNTEEISDRLAQAGSERILRYYISQGDEQIDGTNSRSRFPESWQSEYMVDNTQQISSIINLSFERVYTRNSADYRFYISPVPQQDSVSGRDLIISHQSGMGAPLHEEPNANLVNHNSDERKTQKNIFLHELGHILGLEHPWDSEDGDFAVNAWSDSHESTRMGYNEHLDGHHEWYSDADVKALRSIWGIAPTPEPTPAPTPEPTPAPIPTPTPEPTPEPFPTLIPKLKSIDDITTQNQVTTFQLTKSVRLQNQQVEMLISGTDNKDKITGSSEGEVLAGGLGKDVLKGGGGADGFLFQNRKGFGKKEADKIKDFNPEDRDSILVDKVVFGLGRKIKLAVVTGKKETNKALGTNNDFIYDTKKGLLFFNANGKEKGWGDGGLFAKLQGAPELGATDFTIV